MTNPCLLVSILAVAGVASCNDANLAGSGELSSPESSNKLGHESKGVDFDTSGGQDDLPKSGNSRGSGGRDQDAGSHSADLITNDDLVTKKDDGYIEINEGEIRRRCQSAPKEYSVTLTFPSNAGNKCDFGVGGNLSAGSGSDIRAVRRFAQEINVPAPKEKIILCDIDISTENKFTVYDDDIVVTVNKWIIASDYLGQAYFEAQLFAKHKGLYQYDFKKIAGSSWPSETVYFGPGVTGIIDTRQNAQTQREGTFSFDLSHEFVLAMPAEEIISPSYDFAFFIHGNRQIDNDCQHDGFEFAINLRYLD